MRKDEIAKRKERVDNPNKCNLSYEEFNPPKSCDYALTEPPYWKPPKRKTCGCLAILSESSAKVTVECKLSNHPYIKTIDK
jgi:hypothetical protein